MRKRSTLMSVLLFVCLTLTALSTLADGSRTGFSSWERKILPWVLFFVISGICGGAAAKK